MGFGLYNQPFQERKKRYLYDLFFALFVVFSMVLVPALRSPISSPVVVALSGDTQVSYTSNRIEGSIPKAITLREGGILAPWILLRARGGVIYVGHGAPRGIWIGSELVEWSDFVEKVQRTPSKKVYVASCYSNRLEQLGEATTKKKVFGFDGPVDVEEAAYSIVANILHKTPITSYMKSGKQKDLPILGNDVEILDVTVYDSTNTIELTFEMTSPEPDAFVDGIVYLDSVRKTSVMGKGVHTVSFDSPEGPHTVTVEMEVGGELVDTDGTEVYVG